MATITRLLLDVLKPHQPNSLTFAGTVADSCGECKVTITVVERDEKTETTLLGIEGKALDFDVIASTIEQLGGSVHSVDEVEVIAEGHTETPAA